MSGDAVARVTVVGELTVTTAAEQRDLLLAALNAADSELELDLGEVNELDTAGLQILLLLRREAAGLGVDLRLTRLSAAADDVLVLAGLDEMRGAA